MSDGVVWFEQYLQSHFIRPQLLSFLVPVMMGLVALISGSCCWIAFLTCERTFLEAGCQWVHFVLERMDDRFRRTRN